MANRMIFGQVQRMAAQVGLAMSRDRGSRDIRLRYRDRPEGPLWVVSTLEEALALIDRQAPRRQPPQGGEQDQAARAGASR